MKVDIPLQALDVGIEVKKRIKKLEYKVKSLERKLRDSIYDKNQLKYDKEEVINKLNTFNEFKRLAMEVFNLKSENE